MNMWEEQFGSVVREFVRAFEGSKMPIRRFVAADDTEITADTVWNTKFASAPGRVRSRPSRRSARLHRRAPPDDVPRQHRALRGQLLLPLRSVPRHVEVDHRRPQGLRARVDTRLQRLVHPRRPARPIASAPSVSPSPTPSTRSTPNASGSSTTACGSSGCPAPRCPAACRRRTPTSTACGACWRRPTCR